MHYPHLALWLALHRVTTNPAPCRSSADASQSIELRSSKPLTPSATPRHFFRRSSSQSLQIGPLRPSSPPASTGPSHLQPRDPVSPVDSSLSTPHKKTSIINFANPTPPTVCLSAPPSDVIHSTALTNKQADLAVRIAHERNADCADLDESSQSTSPERPILARRPSAGPGDRQKVNPDRHLSSTQRFPPQRAQHAQVLSFRHSFIPFPSLTISILPTSQVIVRTSTPVGPVVNAHTSPSSASRPSSSGFVSADAHQPFTSSQLDLIPSNYTLPCFSANALATFLSLLVVALTLVAATLPTARTVKNTVQDVAVGPHRTTRNPLFAMNSFRLFHSPYLLCTHALGRSL
ncbi:hypothetical protein BC826DRAFT_1107589 [Russula brevipes]|nr:hypothetical protein BC826DRAFT_1107589 [Russula brevipes]